MTERQAEARALREQGLSFREVGERLGISAVSAQRLCDPKARRRGATYQRWRARRRAERGAERRALIAAAKAGGCLDCGAQFDARGLQFHHRDPATKEFDVSRSRQGLERVRAEIAKCDVLCARCHRARHRTEAA